MSRNADSHLENGSDYDSDDATSAVRYFPNLLIPEVDRVLRTADFWHFNAFHLREATNDAPLSTLCFYFLQTTGLIREFGAHLDEIGLTWLQHVWRSQAAHILCMHHHAWVSSAPLMQVDHLINCRHALLISLPSACMGIAVLTTAMLLHDFGTDILVN